jgi:hypothetical protein
VIVSFWHAHATPLYGVGQVIEQAELDAFCVLGEQREVDPFAVPRASQYMGLTRPDAHVHRSANTYSVI